MPAVVVLDGAHFAVYEGVRRGRVRLNDPSSGPRSTSVDQFVDEFAGIALGLRPGPDFRQLGTRTPYLRALGTRVRPYLTHLVLPVVAALLAALALVATSLLIRAFVAALADRSGGTAVGWLWTALLAGCGLAVAATVLQQLALARLLTVISVSTTESFLWRLLRLPGTFFSRRQIGGLVTRVQLNDGLAVLISARLAGTLAALVTASVYLAVMLWLDARLALVAVGAAIADAVVTGLIARRRSVEQHHLQSVTERRDGIAFAGLADIETVKADGAEDWFFARWAGWQARGLNVDQRLASRLQSLLVLPTTVATAAAGLLVVLGALGVLAGTVSLGTVLAFQLLLGGFLTPVTSLVGLAADMMSARGQIALLDDVDRQRPDPYLTPLTRPATATALRGDLELRDVTFGYHPGAAPLLTGLTLTVPAGARVAVVGASGSGKSTVARLAAGVLRPWSGEVCVDGRRRDDIPRAEMTLELGYVEQELRLFEGTVRDNLTLWDPSLAEDRLARAMADAQIDDVVRRRGGLDGGWIEEGARNLSGGERQRLEIARTLALDPKILVLDEATSALDADTELLVDRAIRDRGCTTLIVAHRLSTVRDADLIVVLDRGRVVEQGTHDELVEADGPYRALLEAGA